VFVILLAVNAMSFDKEFEEFKIRFKKIYENEEEHDKRYEIFVKNLELIDTHNDKGLSWRLKMNLFGDLEWEEFRSNRIGLKGLMEAHPIVVKATHGRDLPNEINWVVEGAVTPVKDQLECGVSWAFAIAGSLESAHFIKTGELVSLSEQQLMDCTVSGMSQGCDGGYIIDAFGDDILTKEGLCADSSYSYMGRLGKCRPCRPITNITTHMDVRHDDEYALKEAVARQPVVVGIQIDRLGFQFYHDGVFDGECGTELDHAVLLVGYGELEDREFWLLKNSWSPLWGDRGYIRLARNINQTGGQCGILMQATYPVLQTESV